jgi:hypothetical protein
MVDYMKASLESGASTSAMERRRHVAWILIDWIVLRKTVGSSSLLFLLVAQSKHVLQCELDDAWIAA